MHAHQTKLLDALHIYALAGFAFAQPLYDVLGKQAEFFVIRDLGTTEILLFAAAVSFIPPTALALLTRLSHIFGTTAYRLSHQIVIAGLIGFILLPAVDLEASGGWLSIALCVLGGVAISYAYYRFGNCYRFFSYVGLAIPVFPLWFLFATPISGIILAENEARVYDTEFASTPPIVMVVLDEFNTAALLDREGNIDAGRYPNFAKLAADATWFKNAIASAVTTEVAVPAILTGSIPPAPALPTASVYPDSIFSLLSGRYKIHAAEAITELCPESVCPRQENLPMRDKLDKLARDLPYIYLHIVLPAPLAGKLPNISQSWEDFDSPAVKQEPESSKDTWGRQLREKIHGDRNQQFRRFVAGIKKSDDESTQPDFHFVHVLLPHAPHQYLPSGTRYTQDSRFRGFLPGTADIWLQDEAIVNREYQRYLLQVGYVDGLIGSLLDKLKNEGMYEDTLLVVTGDHGVAYRPSDSRRHLTPGNVGGILAVPMFIKTPRHDKTAVNPANAQTVDILPTIVDILGARVPWRTDGLPLFSSSLPAQRKVTRQDFVQQEFDNIQGQLLAATQRKLAWFGDSSLSTFPIHGAGSRLIGKSVAQLPVKASTAFRATVKSDTGVVKDGALPLFLRGTLESENSTPPPPYIALAFNGVIRELIATTTTRHERTLFSTVLNERWLEPPGTKLALYGLTTRDVAAELLPIALDYSSEVSVDAKTQEFLEIRGHKYRIRQRRSRGWVETVSTEGDNKFYQGWVVEHENPRVPSRIFVLIDQEFYGVQTGFHNRGDVAAALKEPAAKQSGFKIRIPEKLTRGKFVQFLALRGDGSVSHIPCPTGCFPSLPPE